MNSEGKIIFEGIACVIDFNKDKTWLFIPQTNSKLEIDEGLDIEHGEFVKMREAKVEPNLYCIVKEYTGKRYFEEAHFTNMTNVDEIKDALVNAGYMRRDNKIKIGRNEPCLCGSGKKYKKCCGSNV